MNNCVSSSFFSTTVLIVVLAVAAPAAQAVEYTITVSNDNDSSNGDCSLREALFAATHNVARDACPAGSPVNRDRITLDTGVTFDGGMYYMNNIQGGELIIQGSTTVATDTVIFLAGGNRLLYLLNADPVTIKDLQVLYGTGNSPRYGGIVRCAATSLSLDNVVFGASTAGYGGAVSFLSLDGAHWLTVENCVIANNTAGGEYDSVGGALWINAAGDTEIRIVSTTISGNSVSTADGTSSSGGGAWIAAGGNATLLIVDSLFDDNSGETENWNRGAGLFLELQDDATAYVHDTVFSNNFWDYPDPTGWDGTDGAHFRATGSSQLVIERCVFSDNNSPNTRTPRQLVLDIEDESTGLAASCLLTGGVRAVTASTADTADVFLSHLTVTENEESVFLSKTGSGIASLANSILSLNNSNPPTAQGGASNLDNFIGGDPHFEDPSTGDYRLQSISAAIDNGNQSRPGLRFCDLDHAPRVNGDETDQGAYEWGGLFADDFETSDTNAWD